MFGVSIAMDAACENNATHSISYFLLVSIPLNSNDRLIFLCDTQNERLCSSFCSEKQKQTEKHHNITREMFYQNIESKMKKKHNDMI